jgi:IPT/TIG domain
MTSILYGNLRIEVRGGVGGRVDRVFLQPALSRATTRPIQRTDNLPTVLVGRDEELDGLRAAVRQRRPIELTATCGYGKTSLLQQVIADSAEAGVYLRVGPEELQDLLTRLVDQLYVSDQRVKLTPEQCAQLLSQVRAAIALDDIDLNAEQVDYLLSILPWCSLVLSSPRPILRRHGISLALGGLPNDAALQLVSRDIGRVPTGAELAAVRRLVVAVDGQPLHLRQAAALIRERGRSFGELAREAERDPTILDRLSVNALAVSERRALAVLALAAGALMPAQLVGSMGDIANVGEVLHLLHRRGLVERRGDRFGLPACKVDGYRKLVLDDLELGAAVRELINWFLARDPTSEQSTSAASAALSILAFAAERGDWPAVARLVQVVEPVLTLAGRWEASRHALTVGLQAAHTSGDQVAEALFSHEQGTLALCLDELADAQRLLQHALDLRERTGDREGAAVTRHNLQILKPPTPPPPTRLPARKLALISTGVLVVVAGLIVGIIKATATQPQAHATDAPSQTVASTPGTTPATPGTTPATTPASTPPSSRPIATPPVVSSIRPMSGGQSGGTSVTISGTGFTGATGVSFGPNSASSFTVDSDAQITAVSPAGQGGTVDLTVSTPAGTSTTSPNDQFTYRVAASPPVDVTSVSPNSGDQGGGTSVTISGTGFTGATGVSFGPNSASSFTVDSDTQITAVSPAGQDGTVDLTVSTPAGTSTTSPNDQFTYQVAASPPVVSSISPTSGPLPGGTAVTISGTGFTGATGVSFGPNPASSYTVDSDTQITAVSPAFYKGGTVDVTVTTPAGTSAASPKDQFTYQVG